MKGGGSHAQRNAQRSDAGWVRREINCAAGWSCAGRSWRWHGPWIAIRSSTDERRAQTRGASKRVRGLQELRAGVERDLHELRAGVEREQQELRERVERE